MEAAGCRGRECCCGGARQALGFHHLWFAVGEIETPAPGVSPSPGSPCAGYPDLTGLVNTCPLLLSAGHRGVRSSCLEAHREPRCLRPPGRFGTDVRTPPCTRFFSRSLPVSSGFLPLCSNRDREIHSSRAMFQSRWSMEEIQLTLLLPEMATSQMGWGRRGMALPQEQEQRKSFLLLDGEPLE